MLLKIHINFVFNEGIKIYNDDGFVWNVLMVGRDLSLERARTVARFARFFTF